MLRAKSILKRWRTEKLKDTEFNHVAPLEYLMELLYSKYQNNCWWAGEKTLTYGKWLTQEIESEI